ncbi:MAG TPA: LysR family transcriptional regulator [Candidatus Acidoferrales bacterium]|nr:LysR family transcriptional regulator [Candidatus Acidoferrales bacterium]
MDLDAIAVFVKVVQAGSFSQAAKLLDMPNSTVSAKVAVLEKQLGVTLLQRTTRKLRVTQAGEVYFKRCVQALEELQAAENEVATAQREPQGLLKLTAPVELGHGLLPALVDGFLQKYPKMGVELLITNRVLDLIAEGVDLAIRAGSLKDSRLIAKRFTLGEFTLWAGPSYLQKHAAPSDPTALTQHECIQFSRFKDSAWSLTNGKETATVTVFGRVVADDFETIRSMACLGAGIGLIPSFLCAEKVKQRELVRILPQWHGDTVWFSFVYPAQRFISPAVRGFISVAETVLKSQKFSAS